MAPRKTIAALTVAGLALALTACSSEDDGGREIVLVTHDSFNVSEGVLEAFTEETGITITVKPVGDGGALANQLVFTKDAPLGDVFFGVDNTFASRILDAGVVEPYTPPAGDAKLDVDDPTNLGVDDAGRLHAIDYSDVCVNLDKQYFVDNGLAEPVTLTDLAKPEYRDLLVVEDPSTSSPGLAFLLATVAEFGADGYQGYWTSLRDNGVKVVSDWTTAYSIDFSGSSGRGDRPLVVSYSSSPPVEMADGDQEAPTAALLETCYRQVEYAGIIKGTERLEDAQKVVDFLLGVDFQNDLPGQMYMYPTNRKASLPAQWQQFAPSATNPRILPAAEVAAEREGWIRGWTDMMDG